MASSRDDFIIAIRSAFLKKSTQQKFSLLTLLTVSIIIIFLSSLDFRVIRYLKIGLNEIVYRMMARNCGQPDDYFANIIHENAHADWFLDAKEAKKHKLATHLRVPKLEISVDVQIEML